MAGNYVQEGDVVTLTAPVGGVVSGTGYLIGSLFVVALVTAAAGAQFSASVEGVFSLPKTSAQAWTEGQKVFWDNTNHRADSDSTVGQLIGVAVVAAANPSATGYVRLNCGVPAMAEGAQGAIVALTDNTGGSGTHDDTLADGLTVTAFVAGSFTGAVDGTVEDIAAAAGACAGGATPSAANVDTAIATAVAPIVAGTNLQLAEMKAKVDALITDAGVQNQNDSDLAQKILEIRSALVAAGIIAA